MKTLTASTIKKTLKTSKPTSLTALFHALGGKGKPGSSARAKIKSAMPSIVAELQRVKDQVAKQASAPAPKVKTPKAVKAPEVKSHQKSEALISYEGKSKDNPYGQKGSAYAAIYDSVKSHPGRGKAWHLASLSKKLGKSEQKLSFDWDVVIRKALDGDSRKAIKMRSTIRHRSTRDGYTTSAHVSKKGNVTYRVN